MKIEGSEAKTVLAFVEIDGKRTSTFLMNKTKFNSGRIGYRKVGAPIILDGKLYYVLVLVTEQTIKSPKK